MTERTKVPEGAPCWIDLWTSDVEGSRRFYCDLFGWRAEEPSEEFGGYFMFTRDGVPVAGGMGDMGDVAADDTWKIYLATPDVQGVVARGEVHGATFHVAPMPVADMGIQTVFSDATGAMTGAWQAVEFPGFMVLDEPATPCWFELNARDYDTAVAFYERVFHLEPKVMGDSNEFRYTTLLGDGLEVAGVFDAASRLGEGVASHWTVYWQVDNVVASLQRVRELGGHVLDGPVDSPYGAIATVSDPAGAIFKLRTSPVG